MASNIKSKPSPKDSPTEPFKRAVTGCLRAIARKPDLEVSFAAERPGLMGGKVRLPEPPRKLSKGEAAIVRGHADAIALRIACHDPAVHRRLQPAGQQARAVFEAVEQARVEAIGARRMDGVAKNLTAMLDEQFHRGKFDDITERADAPIEDALALMVRERLTGLAPPPAAKKLVDLWRPLIEDRAGRDLDRLESVVEDQKQFGDAVHDLLDALEMGDDRNRDSDEEDEDGEEDRRKQDSGEDGDADDSDEMNRMSTEDTQVSAEDMPDSAAEAADAPTADMADDTDMGDAETPGEPQRPRQFGDNQPRGPDYRAFTMQVRRDHRRRGTVRAGGTGPPARLSRQAVVESAGRGRPPRQPPAAPADGAAEPLLGIRPRGGPARSGPPVAHRHRSACSRCRSRPRRTRSSATPW